MRVPISWLRDYVDTNAAPERIADALTARGFAVDAVDIQPMPDRIVVGRIDALSPHPNAGKLQVSIVDIGTGKLQIVTGAENVAVGDRVPIALVGAVVFDRSVANGARSTKAIQKATLRGVESVGMMCSATELALPGEFGDGILIMEPDAAIGADFWKAARYGDAVLDVDVTSNRADCLSIVGLARETAAGLSVPFRDPVWEEGAGDRPSPIAVAIEDPSVCRRLIGQHFAGVTNRRSPTWMTLRLQGAGVRSLNFLVDVSNYVQIETGQPLHFYDARRLRGGKIVARAARAGEKVVTLDGVERSLDAGIPVIADGERVVGIAGIFGGAVTGVAQDTTDVFLESPNFVGARVRRASIALGLRTEGAMRHERNLPLELADFGRRRAAKLFADAGARGSAVVEAGERPGPLRRFDVRPKRVNALLGTAYGGAAMKAALGPIGIGASGDDPIAVTVPWWRPDIVEEVDVIEEVARGIGYGEIAEQRGAASPQSVDESLFDQDQSIANVCASLGYREIITIALQGTRSVSAWERSGIAFWKRLATVVNPLSDDQRFLRPSLLPGVLTAASRAWTRAGGTLKLFEIGHIFRPIERGGDEETATRDGMYAENGVIEWPSACAVAAFAAGDESGAVDRRLLAIKGEAERLISQFDEKDIRTAPEQRAYFHPGAAGNLVVGDRTVAKFGRLHPRLALAYELPETTYAFMLYMENLPTTRPVHIFEALPRYPGTRRDIAVVVPENISAGALMRAVREAGAAFIEDVSAFDEYTGPQVADGKKSVALAVLLRRPDGTITDAEADASVHMIVGVLREEFDAALRGPASA